MEEDTNKLSYMCLNTIASVRLVKPKVNVRAHKGIVRKLLEAACWVIALGLGQPTLYNDEVAIPALVKTGIRLEDTREYSNDGCTELLMPGKSDLAFHICLMVQELHNFLFGLDVERFPHV